MRGARGIEGTTIRSSNGLFTEVPGRGTLGSPHAAWGMGGGVSPEQSGYDINDNNFV